LSWAFREPELYQEALDNTEKGVRIGEKIGDYNITALMLWRSAIMYEKRGDYGAAIAQNLKAAEYAERTNSYVAQRNCYGLLVREYVRLGEIEHAEEFAKKLRKTYDKAGSLKSDVSVSDALLLTAKDKWKEANEIFEKVIEKKGKNLWGSEKEVSERNYYAWALAKQGRNEEARKQLEIAEKMREKAVIELAGLAHANVQAYLMARREAGVGEEFMVRLDLVNVATKPALIVKIEGLIPPGVKISTLPPNRSVHNSSLEMNQTKLSPFGVEHIKLSLQATKSGDFTLDPQVIYIDDKGETHISKPKPVVVTVLPTLHARIGEETISAPVLPGRVSTGFEALDALLLGGIPENSAIVLAAPNSDEKNLLLNRFLKTGIEANEPTFLVTNEASEASAWTEKYQTTFYLVLCNPQANSLVQSGPNVYTFKGAENLTDIDIALTKAYRTLSSSTPSQKRICIDIVSDALLQHHTVGTRRWLSSLLPTLKLKGFTVLAFFNPQMHSPEEAQAVLGLFDGEIRISERENAKGMEKVLRIRNLRNQRYLENQLVLVKEELGH
jgi:KaiC/GvpD/RAD55 family RecA-like ATPase